MNGDAPSLHRGREPSHETRRVDGGAVRRPRAAERVGDLGELGDLGGVQESVVVRTEPPGVEVADLGPHALELARVAGH